MLTVQEFIAKYKRSEAAKAAARDFHRALWFGRPTIFPTQPFDVYPPIGAPRLPDPIMHTAPLAAIVAQEAQHELRDIVEPL